MENKNNNNENIIVDQEKNAESTKLDDNEEDLKLLNVQKFFRECDEDYINCYLQEFNNQESVDVIKEIKEISEKCKVFIIQKETSKVDCENAKKNTGKNYREGNIDFQNAQKEFEKRDSQLKEELNKINSKIKETIETNIKVCKNLNKIALDPKKATENLISNLPYLIFLYYAITLNKAKNLKEAIELYKENKTKFISHLYDKTKKTNAIIRFGIKIRKGEERAKDKKEEIFENNIFFWSVVVVSGIILTIYNYFNGNGLIDSCCYLVFGLVSVIVLLIELPKSIYADRNKKESEEYIIENLFDKPEEVIKEFVQNL